MLRSCVRWCLDILCSYCVFTSVLNASFCYSFVSFRFSQVVELTCSFPSANLMFTLTFRGGMVPGKNSMHIALYVFDNGLSSSVCNHHVNLCITCGNKGSTCCLPIRPCDFLFWWLLKPRCLCSDDSGEATNRCLRSLPVCGISFAHSVSLPKMWDPNILFSLWSLACNLVFKSPTTIWYSPCFGSSKVSVISTFVAMGNSYNWK